MQSQLSDGVTGTTDIAYIGSHAGENQYGYSMDESGGSVTFDVNATAITGDPRNKLQCGMVLTLQYWAASDSVDLTTGEIH